MGMHLGFIAVECSVKELREAFIGFSKHFEVKASKTDFGDASELHEWTQEFEMANTHIFSFFDDGPYAILMDFRHVVTCDEKLLAKLSSKFGTVLSFAIETAGGCAYFWCFKDGELRRYLGYSDGVLEKKGRALKQEQGIDIKDCYYMSETEELWSAFGLSPYERMAKPALEGICMTDKRINRF